MGKADNPVDAYHLGSSKALFQNELEEVFQSLSDARLEVELNDSLRMLSVKGLTNRDGMANWSLTAQGYQVFDLIMKQAN